jgi:transcriptional regulator with XRE-family HTH domain
MNVSRGLGKPVLPGKFALRQRAIQGQQAVNPGIFHPSRPKLADPARRDDVPSRICQLGVRGFAGQKTVPQTDHVGLNVHAIESNNKLLDRQVTNCLTLALGFSGMKKSPREILAANVLRLRNARGWSQPQLAQHSGLKQTTISNIERQAVDTGVDNLELLAKAFKLPLWALLLPEVDESMFQGEGLGQVVGIYPELKAEGRSEIVRTAVRERRYLNTVPMPSPRTTT